MSHYFKEIAASRVTSQFPISSITARSPSMSQCQYQVITSNSIVGHIHIDSREGNPDLIYSSSWHQHPESFALSSHLPLFSDRLSTQKIARHLANLLPEGLFPWVDATNDKLSTPNVATFVQASGPEPSGAFSIRQFESDAKHPVDTPPIFEQLSDDELNDRIASRSRIHFSFWHGRYYQSLAGTQDKMQVGLSDGKLYLLDGSLSSTHIIKPEARDPATPFMVANEHYCMSLASAMGLPVAPVHIRRTPAPVLVVERFDRKWSAQSDILKPGTVTRVHTIDGCQAVGAASWEKYEQGVENPSVGVGFKRLFNLGPLFTNPDEARLFIIRWALFGLLIGNSAVHAKNISFFQTNEGLTPAPMYDLTSTRVYGDAILQKLAVGYGGAFKFEDISEAQMVRFAEDADTPIDQIAFEMSRLATTAQKHFQHLAEADTYTQSEQALVREIANIVRARIGWTHEMADRLLVRKVTLRGAS